MDVSSLGGKNSANQSGTAQRAEAEQVIKKPEPATERKVAAPSKNEQNREASESVSRQKVAAKPQADESSKNQKSQARPQVSDAISRAAVKQQTSKSSERRAESSSDSSDSVKAKDSSSQQQPEQEAERISHDGAAQKERVSL